MTNETDIICPMYRFPEWCVRMSKTDAKKRPVILCEYGHSMGNSGGGLEDYWELFYSNEYPRMQGMHYVMLCYVFFVMFIMFVILLVLLMLRV